MGLLRSASLFRNLRQPVWPLRLRLRCVSRSFKLRGRTVIPLTRQPDGMQAWKIIIPTSNATPEPRSHDGGEWIYVLSGYMRFVLGNQDLVLGPGEVAAFDTKVPHWFGSTGDAPAEILSIFGRPGERMTMDDTSVKPGRTDTDSVCSRSRQICAGTTDTFAACRSHRVGAQDVCRGARTPGTKVK